MLPIPCGGPHPAVAVASATLSRSAGEGQDGAASQPLSRIAGEGGSGRSPETGEGLPAHRDRIRSTQRSRPLAAGTGSGSASAAAKSGA